MKKNTVPLSIIASGVLLSTLLTGCNANPHDTGAFVGEQISSGYEESFNPVGEEISYPTSFEEVETIKPEESNNILDFLKLLKNYDLSQFDIDTILENPDDYSINIQNAAAYQNIINHGLTFDDIKEELHNIVLWGQVSRCVDEDTFFALVGKLFYTLPDRCNPFSSYATLARSIHMIDCPLVHGFNDSGNFTCAALKEEYNDLTSVRKFLLRTFGDDQEFMNLMSFFANDSDETLNELINEFEYIVTFGLLPASEVDEYTWYHCFGLLLKTVEPTESLFEKYTGLALRIHNKLFPEDQIIFSENINYYERVLKS